MKLKTLVKKAVKAILPYGVVALHRRNRERLAVKELYGNDPASYCPVCGKTSYFKPFGYPPRQKAACPRCGSVERHRLLWIFLQRKTDLFKRAAGKMLHVAAEPCFESRFKKAFGRNYVTADLYNPDAMVKMDITGIQYPNESFDIVICNHVLEHVSDDLKAIREFYRVLKKGGWAILLVPIADIDKTYEDFSINTDAGRLAAFGQADHVRKYGKDYIERLKSADFTVSVVKADDIANIEEIKSMCLHEETQIWGFTRTEIYFCQK